MLFGARVRVAPHHNLVGVVRVLGNIEGGMPNNIAGILSLIAVRTPQLQSPKVGTQLVLEL